MMEKTKELLKIVKKPKAEYPLLNRINSEPSATLINHALQLSLCLRRTHPINLFHLREPNQTEKPKDISY